MLVALLLLVTMSSLSATSLWNDQQTNNTSFFSEIKGLVVGDIVTVVIVEQSTASNRASTQNTKQTSISGGAGTGPLSVIKAMGADTESDFQGDGSTTSTTSLQTRISARVMKVLPNGNMIIEGKKFNQINKEIQEVFVKGMVRPVDISSDNTVFSTALADAEIKLVGHGGSADAVRPGLMNRIYNFVF
jgi:flagellar L-ring protein precursor FlgH